MNPITNIRNQNKIATRELELGVIGGSGRSWHDKYTNSAWIYIGGLPYDLNEGDIIAVFSQYGEIVNINLIRDHKTGKSRGFAFLCYQDQRSTVLAVDNFNGIKLLKRIIRVDHVEEYKVPKYREDVDEEIRRLWEEGCAPKPINITQANEGDNESSMRSFRKRCKVDEDGVIELSDEVRRQIKREEKRAKKEARRAEKERRREKKERERLAAEEASALVAKEEGGDKGSWKEQRKLVDTMPYNDEDIYGSNEHFNFGKPKKELPALPTHNPRPDFEKADWRDIEMWKAIREKEKQEKGDAQSTWKEEEHYLPSRFRRD